MKQKLQVRDGVVGDERIGGKLIGAFVYYPLLPILLPLADFPDTEETGRCIEWVIFPAAVQKLVKLRLRAL